MHELCPVQEEVIKKYTPTEQNGEVIWYVNDGFRPENTVVGWANIGSTSRPVTREIVGRVADSVVLFADGSEKIKIRTYVRSYKNDYPLSLLGGRISRSWPNETSEERELTELFSRDYAATLSYSHFAADPEMLFPDVELNLSGLPQQIPVNEAITDEPAPQLVPVLSLVPR